MKKKRHILTTHPHCSASLAARRFVPAVHYDGPRVRNASLCPVHLVQKAQDPSWLIGHPVVRPAKILIVLHQPRALVLRGAETHRLVRNPLLLGSFSFLSFYQSRVKVAQNLSSGTIKFNKKTPKQREKPQVLPRGVPSPGEWADSSRGLTLSVRRISSSRR